MLSTLIPGLSTRHLVLASASPRRKQLLEHIGLEFSVVPSGFAEDLDKGLYHGRPEAYVLDNARLKAAHVLAATPSPDNLTILACDTVVYHGDQIVEKPRDADQAVQTLATLSGESHHVYTGVALLSRTSGEPKAREFFEKTRVQFGVLGEELIRAYVDSGEPLDKAGAYGIQGLGCLLVEGIQGDYFNVIGLPLFSLRTHLAQHLASLS